MALSQHSRTLCKDKTNAMKQQLHAGITAPCCPLVVVVTLSHSVSLAGELGLRLRELQRRHAGHAPDEGQTATPSGHMTLTACHSLTSPSFSLSPRRQDVSDVVAFGRLLLSRHRRAGARSEETAELLGEWVTSDPWWRWRGEERWGKGSVFLLWSDDIR